MHFVFQHRPDDGQQLNTPHSGIGTKQKVTGVTPGWKVTKLLEGGDSEGISDLGPYVTIWITRSQSCLLSYSILCALSVLVYKMALDTFAFKCFLGPCFFLFFSKLYRWNSF